MLAAADEEAQVVPRPARLRGAERRGDRVRPGLHDHVDDRHRRAPVAARGGRVGERDDVVVPGGLLERVGAVVGLVLRDERAALRAVRGRRG